MKDSVAIDDFSKKLAIYKAATENEKKQNEIALLNQEKLISGQHLDLSKQKLKAESFVKNILISGVFILVLFGFIVFRNITLKRKNESHRHEIVQKELILQKLESERTRSELQQQATELEMQALRAQMNPHFIFNSLNSINRFILQNNKLQASEYLTKFSKLVRLILQNSQSSLIPLESELEALQLYLELEAVRFDHHFVFNIRINGDIDTPAIKVPPLIIQPYAENAIWHGLMHKEEKGHLQIELSEEEDRLCCKIVDDGVGRKKAGELKSKSASAHKSMGMQITANRIAKLQKNAQVETEIKITDLVLPDGSAGGTEVLLKIPVCYD
jgi:LytS/YehU family sensor histidine kinase